jgi:hypothetical protein
VACCLVAGVLDAKKVESDAVQRFAFPYGQSPRAVMLLTGK